MEEIDLEYIRGKYLQIIENCVEFARKFLLLPHTIDYYFEECPSELFPTLDNAAESNGKALFFNKPWFLQRVDEHRDDLEFFIFHELRHVHQLYSIFLYDNNRHCNDDLTTIETWKRGYKEYIRNTDDTTTNVNVSQEIEIDANAYAQCLVNLLHIDDDIELCFSLPAAARELSNTRSLEYYTKPEIKQYIEDYKIRQQQKYIVQQPKLKNIPIRKNYKVSANDPCPCGSGKKFKHCCRGNGKFD